MNNENGLKKFLRNIARMIKNALKFNKNYTPANNKAMTPKQRHNKRYPVNTYHSALLKPFYQMSKSEQKCAIHWGLISGRDLILGFNEKELTDNQKKAVAG